MAKVNIGIVGFGNMGQNYTKELLNGINEDVVVTAVCVSSVCSEKKAKEFLSSLNVIDNISSTASKIKIYTDYDAFLRLSGVHAVLITTPNKLHVQMVKKALQAKKHVLVEKPIGDKLEEINELNEFADAIIKKDSLVFSIMYNMRANKEIQMLKNILSSKRLGKIQRVKYEVLNFYRPESYYTATEYRGGWENDGGGVLLNQAIHQLDIFTYLFGMPSNVTAKCRFGAHRPIEVEDEATLLFEFFNNTNKNAVPLLEDGATALFITTVNEPFGTDTLQVICENGMITYNAGESIKIIEMNTDYRSQSAITDPFSGNHSDILAHRITSTIDFTTEFSNWITDRENIVKNFTDNILGKSSKLLSPGIEGKNTIELINASYLSTWEGKTITLPLNVPHFREVFNKNI